MTNEPISVSSQQMARKIAVGLGIIVLSLLAVGSMLAASSDVPLGNTTSYATHVSLALDANDNPIFSFLFVPESFWGTYLGPNLSLFACDDQACDHQVGGSEQASYLAPYMGAGGSLALDSADNPVFAYSKLPAKDLMLLHCDDERCSEAVFQGESVHMVDSANDVGSYTSLALDAVGNPVIAYYDETLSDLKLAHCNDPNCDPAANGAESIQVVDANDAGRYASLALDASGNPVIAYYSGTQIKVAHCNDANCNASVNGAESIETIDTVWGAGLAPSTLSLKLGQFGYPVVAYSYFQSALRLAACNDANCGAANGAETPITIDDAGDVGEYASMVLDETGSPVMSYYDRTNGDLKLAWCSTPNCTGLITIEVAASQGNVGTNTAIALADSGALVIAYREEFPSAMHVLRWFPDQLTAPSNLRATSNGSSSLLLEWTDNSSDEALFQIQYLVPSANFPGSWHYSTVIDVPANVTGYSLNNTDCGVPFNLRIRALRSGDQAPSEWSDTLSIAALPCTLSAPSNFTLSTVASNINLAWSDTSATETGFEIQRTTTVFQWGPSAYEPLTIRAANSTSYTDSAVTCGSGYYYRIRAIGNSGAKSAWVIKSTGFACPMPPPTNFTATPVALGQIDLSWTDSSPYESEYWLERSVDGTTWATPYHAYGTTYSDTTVSCGTIYHYRVRPVLVNWYTPPEYASTSVSMPACPAAPNAPTGLGATVAGSGQVTLNWTDNSSDEAGFSIERRTTSELTFTQIDLTAANATSYVIAPSCVDAFYRVRAYRTAGNQYSSEVTVFADVPACSATPAPANLTATNKTWYAELNWQNTISGTTTFYQVSNDGVSWPMGGNGSSTPTSAYAFSQSCGTPKYYRAYATSPGRAQSAYSNVASLTIPCPSAPTNLALESNWPGQIELNWTNISGDLTSFLIERSPNGSTGWVTVGISTQNRSHHSDAGLTCGTTYYYRVRGYYNHDYLSTAGYSAYSNIIGIQVPCASGPAAPSQLAAASISMTQINLSWTDNSSDETSFKIERSADGVSGWTQIGTTSANVNTFSDTVALCGEPYFYRVRAYRTSGNRHSIYSNTARATTASCSDTTPPSVPTPISPARLAVIYDTTPTFDWTDSTGNPTLYEFLLSDNPNLSNEIVNLTVTESTYTLPAPLTLGEYFWSVRARDEAGNWSDWYDTGSPFSFTLSDSPLTTGYYEQETIGLTYSGNWQLISDAGASGGSFRRTNDPNAYVTFSFTGTRMTLYTLKFSNRGSMEICLDVSNCTIFNANSASLIWQFPVVFNVSSGTHTVKIRNLSGAYIDVDAVRIEIVATATPPTPTSTPTDMPTPTLTPTATNTPGAGLPNGYYEQENAALTYSGNWQLINDAGASGGSFRRTNDPNAYVTYSFTGTRMTLYTLKFSNRGSMEICLDVSNCTTFNANSASLIWQFPVVFNVSSGTHTVKIRNLSGAYIDVDAVRIESIGTATPTLTPTATQTPTLTTTATNTPGAGLPNGYYEQENAALTYSGNWQLINDAGASGGSFRRTNDPNAYVTFSFTGTRMILYTLKFSNRGSMEICIDVSNCTTFNANSASLIWQFPVVFNVSSGPHTVKIRNLSGAYIDVDAVRIETIGMATPTLTPTATQTPTLTPTATNTPSAGLPNGYYEQENAALTYSGNWQLINDAGASGSSFRRTNDPNAFVTFSFTGTRLTLYTLKFSNRGSMEICIDATNCTTFNANSASLIWQFPVVFNVSSGTHTVKIRNLSGAYIDVDAVRIETDTPPLTIVPITWSIIGLDAADVNAGPNEYPVGVRVCNTGTTAANNVTVAYEWTGTVNDRISLINAAPQTLISLGGSACDDVYFWVRVTRNAASLDTTRSWRITATAGSQSVNTTQTLQVKALTAISGSSTVIINGPTNLTVGQTAAYTVTAQTAVSNSELEHFINFCADMFSIDSVTASYTQPASSTTDRLWADGCAWNTATNSGCTQTPGTTYGGGLNYTISVTARAAGNCTLRNVVYDFNNNAYHYNNDYPSDTIAVTIAAAQPTPTTTSGAGLQNGYYEQENAALTYSGNWQLLNDPGASGGTFRRTNDPNAYVTFAFTGTRMTLYTLKFSNRGSMEICIDTTNCTTFNANSPSLIWQFPVERNVASGSHTVKIRNLSGAYIDVDAIRIETIGGGSGSSQKIMRSNSHWMNELFLQFMGFISLRS